jgi:hypothetical protein
MHERTLPPDPFPAAPDDAEWPPVAPQPAPPAVPLSEPALVAASLDAQIFAALVSP